ncbi:helix-turn-helix domain-containing protein [Bacillus mangrovi]|uniref:Helix-turn-helix domain-containing protein n=1 Tax=Metabacillus mangrovi TaxID=1491830 RepID=A0A7X2S8U2_9BACI|nr:effector binding domain-containing protein [Metabacillus mangrovi]MTH55772.1 helix-turn-helix domain-containing protein [Metabacillus mangrovi]
MEALTRLNESIQYMEERLGSEIQMEEAAAAACMSKFHFHRMFQMVTGLTPGEYVRKRRLTLAAQELILSDAKVIDVAYKYGYESPESFSKAFRNAHGISPREARQSKSFLKAYPRISFHIQLKGEKEMNYRIVEKPSFQVIGKSIVTPSNQEQDQTISRFWEEANEAGGLSDQLAPHCGPLGFLGICLDHNHEKETMRYLISIEASDEGLPANFEKRTIPAYTWAVFESTGAMPHAIQEVWTRIFSEWFPSTGFEHAGGPEMEVYPKEGDPYQPGYKCEVWVPIVKK